MQFTDSHHHLQDYKVKNTQQIINGLKNEGFFKVVCVSSHPSDWDHVADIAEKNSDIIIPAFGIHPWYIKEAPENWEQKLEEFLVRFPFAQVGECGLDRLKAPVWEGQTEIFEKHINLARRYARPLNIHLLKAENDFHFFLHKLPQNFMLHSFSGNLVFLRKVLDCGAYISLSSATLKRKNFSEIIDTLPLNRLLTETDAPYQTSSAEMINFVIQLSKIKKLSEEELAKIIFQNFENFNFLR